MPLKRLEISKFTAFESLEVQFSPGINVIIGPNSTGKSHLMKLAYALHRALEVGQVEDLGLRLEGLFRPDSLGRLVRRALGRRTAKVHAEFDEGALTFKLSSLGKMTPELSRHTEPQKAVFLPSRELLAMYEGFIQAYENRELSFDETYFDGCKALSGVALRGPRGAQAASLAEPIYEALGGRVVLAGNRFYVQQADGQLEAHLLSEGLRKIGSLAHLIANGSLRENGVLFWDEPEANLNPQLVSQVVDFLLALARRDVQIVLSTHDHLLTRRLSLVAQYPHEQPVGMRFISLFRGEVGSSVEEANLLSELEHNPILDEFARFYEDEQAAAAEDLERTLEEK
ncbi:AAA family ATPase [Corallococcus exiguus]|uniref:AAA family ATPase n=1 Tax=Corallococcus exiguus TaxID=83462 RepID=UPI0015615A55|nr:AAA family ATPase [Corallococcus exiguus]NRD59217.1 AAA family ATPase [Corallococcus exiguus]